MQDIGHVTMFHVISSVSELTFALMLLLVGAGPTEVVAQCHDIVLYTTLICQFLFHVNRPCIH